AADEARSAAQDEVALELDAVVAVVLRRDVAGDVVVGEGHGALGSSCLWREDVEGIGLAVDRAREALVRERHPMLDAVGPNGLVTSHGAERWADHVGAIPDAGSLDRRTGGYEQCQRSDCERGDANAGRLVNTGRVHRGDLPG